MISAARLFLVAAASLLAASPSSASAASKERRPSLPFVQNQGQLRKEVAFSAATGAGTVLVERNGHLVYSRPHRPSLTEILVSGSPHPTGGARAATRVSYFLGNDKSRWSSSTPTFEEVELGTVWKGVSARLRATATGVEKIFTVVPGATVERIRIRVDPAQLLSIDAGGRLVAHVGGEAIRFTAPVAYQERGSGRQAVSASYDLHGSSYGFRLGDHDPDLPVVIDPVLQSTYIGGSDSDSVDALVIDPGTGDVIAAGHSFSNPGHEVDGFVARYDPSLRTLREFAYLGGARSEEILGIAVDPSTGDVLVAGFTSSNDFPGTASGAQPALAALTDGFVARLDPTLSSLRGSTYFGGTNADKILGVAVHPADGEVFVAGQTISMDLPGTAGAGMPDYNGNLDGFVARFDPTLARLNQATYLMPNRTILRAMTIEAATGDVLAAGHADDAASFLARLNRSLTAAAVPVFLNVSGGGDLDLFAIAVDPASGDLLGAGWTTDPALLYAGGGAQPQPGGSPTASDALVVRVDPTLTVWKQSTYFGGIDDDYAYGIAIHPASGDVYITGETLSADLPGAPLDPAGAFDGFVARFDSALTHLIATAGFSGSGDDTPLAIAVSPGGRVVVAGTSTSPDLPGVSCGAQSHYAGGSVDFGGDGFVALFSADLSDAGPHAEAAPCGSSRVPVEVGSRPAAPRTVARPAGAEGPASRGAEE